MNINDFMAEKVMGWTKQRDLYNCNMFWYLGTTIVCACKEWHPDTDLNQTRMCAEKYQCDNAFDLYRNSDGLGYECSLYDSDGKTVGHSVDVSSSIAICEAIKEAMDE